MNILPRLIESQKRFVSWHLILVTCVLLIFAHVMFLMNITHFAVSQEVYWARFAHIALAVLVLSYILIKKEKCESRTCTLLFVVLYIPFYYMQWAFHSDLAASSLVWVPIATFRIHFFALALLVPGSYLVNFILMSGFAVEAVFVWFYFDVPHLPNVVIQGEPMYTILFCIISMSFLAFRFRDEQIIKKLYLKQARSEVFESLARVFLSIQDRSNTPIQTLSISVELLKQKSSVDKEAILIIENSVKKLTLLSDILKKTESNLATRGLELMSDEELRNWFKEIDEKQS